MMVGYVRKQRLVDARMVFNRMRKRDEVSWNTMITGYAENGYVKNWMCKRMDMAKELFDGMLCQNTSSWNTMITGYAENGDIDRVRNIAALEFGKQVYGRLVKAKCASCNVLKQRLVDARMVFNRMRERDEVSWNTMITGYAENGYMIDMAKELFDGVICQNISSWNTIITGYAQNGDIDRVRSMLNEMPQRESISWADDCWPRLD
ncbi:hypothetical protein Syun_022150 [Stephania yunnanensis]|uniref:Pentatricopeptide repeat-containing protein n=1 Tax=Stephania yunnanensis TaxID=152371 RepID=A0AAP0IHY4_9MAGN